MSLPVLAPVKSRLMASGAFSRPSAMVSRSLILAEHFPLAELGGGFQEARSVVQEKEALDAKPLQKNGAHAHHAGIFPGCL